MTVRSATSHELQLNNRPAYSILNASPNETTENGMYETSFSLLERLREQPGEADWRRLVTLYTPLIQAWLRRQATLSQADADDLTQEVMSVLVRELPAFQHNQQTGAFRRWLRNIAVNRLRGHLRSRHYHPVGTGDSAVFNMLDQLEDAGSHQSRVWDAEHDQHVARQLLQMLEQEFQPSTWQAFCRTALDGAKPADVAAELGLTVKAVIVAKSRVLKRLREEARGLID